MLNIQYINTSYQALITDILALANEQLLIDSTENLLVSA